MPSSLELLSLFEEHSSKSPNARDIMNLYGTDDFQSSRIQILDGLAGRGVHLKHLSISFMSDAMDCFKFPANALPNLQSLAITSQEYFQPTINDWKVDKLLEEAAIAVTKLPGLQIMELWNCENGHAAIFRYEATERPRNCKLMWRSSWCTTDWTIKANVTKAWEHTAHILSRQLTFTLNPLPPDPYLQNGAILRHLKLRDLILTPVSAMQVKVGTDEEGQPEVSVWRASKSYSPVWSASQES